MTIDSYSRYGPCKDCCQYVDVVFEKSDSRWRMYPERATPVWYGGLHPLRGQPYYTNTSGQHIEPFLGCNGAVYHANDASLQLELWQRNVLNGLDESLVWASGLGNLLPAVQGQTILRVGSDPRVRAFQSFGGRAVVVGRSVDPQSNDQTVYVQVREVESGDILTEVEQSFNEATDLETDDNELFRAMIDCSDAIAIGAELLLVWARRLVPWYDSEGGLPRERPEIHLVNLSTLQAFAQSIECDAAAVIPYGAEPEYFQPTFAFVGEAIWTTADDGLWVGPADFCEWVERVPEDVDQDELNFNGPASVHCGNIYGYGGLTSLEKDDDGNPLPAERAVFRYNPGGDGASPLATFERPLDNEPTDVIKIPSSPFGPFAVAPYENQAVYVVRDTYPGGTDRCEPGTVSCGDGGFGDVELDDCCPDGLDDAISIVGAKPFGPAVLPECGGCVGYRTTAFVVLGAALCPDHCIESMQGFAGADGGGVTGLGNACVYQLDIQCRSASLSVAVCGPREDCEFLGIAFVSKNQATGEQCIGMKRFYWNSAIQPTECEDL